MGLENPPSEPVGVLPEKVEQEVSEVDEEEESGVEMIHRPWHEIEVAEGIDILVD